MKFSLNILMKLRKRQKQFLIGNLFNLMFKTTVVQKTAPYKRVANIYVYLMICVVRSKYQ